MARTALIFGVSGQDGAYLAQFLLSRGYAVHGTSRDSEIASFRNLEILGIRGDVQVHSVALHDFRNIVQVIRQAKPDEIYNLSAQSAVGLSFEQPVETIDSILNGTLNILESIRFLDIDTRFYHASSSESFGDTLDGPASEATAFRPCSPYGVAKSAAHWLVANYRQAYGLFACSGILFNHESPLRPARFVTRKIIRGAIAVAQGRLSKLEMGNLSVARDWGWAPEYVDAMWRMLQQETPDDFVIATGRMHALEDFARMAFERFGLDWRDHVVQDRMQRRPMDIHYSVGNPAKAEARLGWKAKTLLPQIIEHLIEAELASAS
ncbi:GDP-mannose 4,6-dehydratase [Azospirillum thermophilum]|uniref:GDP-mannose 4,6-dehydratase n=1 Tax=Azospirillum thermophilum TaxID=2202148 RepID=A0A2S2D0K2_9PROT|nr:GDP-mannose 4,6-dehydratase [Azospirillum thermophilum]AWK90289.1 GDP-mannose 4,6-dehydratase [Azospirillum thermophilum]